MTNDIMANEINYLSAMDFPFQFLFLITLALYLKRVFLQYPSLTGRYY